MKKIISILLALGLILGLTVMAAPMSAACPNTPQGCTVTVSPSVECEIGCYTVNFTTSSVGGLAPGDDIVITFPSCAGVTGANATVNGATTTLVVVGMELHIDVPAAINASQKVSILVCNVTNCVAGTYTLLARTTWDYCDCSMSFTIKKGGSVSPTSAIWCINSCKNVTTTITWEGSTSVLNVSVCNGTALPGWAIAADNKTLQIPCADLVALNLQPCSVTSICIDFSPGCNVTMNITAAETFNLTLNSGWNLISLPIIPLSTAIGDVLKDVDSKVSAVWYWDGCADKWLVYKNGTGFTSLTTMDVCKAYWICMTAAANLTVCGYRFPCPPGTPPCCCYCDCWNMVGFNSLVTRNMSDYTANRSPATSLVGVVTWTKAGGWTTVTPSTTMNPGQGYFMAFTANTCIVPPL